MDLVSRFSSRWHLFSDGAKTNAKLGARLADRATMAVKLLDVGPGKPRRHESAVYMAWTDKMSSYKTLDLNPEVNPDFLCDITKHTGIPDGSFDVVVCENVLEHIYDFKSALKELKRVCGGILVISVPFIHQYHEFPNDFWRFSHTAMERLLADMEYVVARPCNGGATTWAVATNNPKFYEVFIK